MRLHATAARVQRRVPDGHRVEGGIVSFLNCKNAILRLGSLNIELYSSLRELLFRASIRSHDVMRFALTTHLFSQNDGVRFTDTFSVYYL